MNNRALLITGYRLEKNASLEPFKKHWKRIAKAGVAAAAVPAAIWYGKDIMPGNIENLAKSQLAKTLAPYKHGAMGTMGALGAIYLYNKLKGNKEDDNEEQQIS